MTAVHLDTSTVPSCHSGGGGSPAPAGAAVVALVGAPNVGKTTLFNALTGARRTVGNWPGTTVEVGRGAWRLPEGRPVDLVDLPGAYSLDPASPDEALTRALLLDVPHEEQPDLVVVTADAAHLTRSLYLVAQLREHDLRLVVALTMTDVASRRGLDVDPDRLRQQLGCPVVPLDPRRRSGGQQLGAAVAAALEEPRPAPRPLAVAAGGSATERGDADDELAVLDERFAWVDAAVQAGVRHTGEDRQSWSDRVDRFATGRVSGPLIFLAAMWAVFQVTTTVAAPMQDGLDWLFSGPVTSGASAALSAIGLGDTFVSGFVLNGLVAGVGMLLTFVPLMALMFLMLALLEDSGYLARAAVVTDRMMRAIGLPGRAFLPLVVGFGCNVPAISATRILPHARQRILTALLIPFTSCSARLTVYVLMATTFFPRHAGTVVFGMYLISIALVVLIGLALRSTLWRTMGAEPLILDLPPYQRPTARLTAIVTWVRLKGFLRTASGIIVAAVTCVWLLQAIPVSSGQDFGHVPVQDSLYATTTRAVSPVFDPAGFGQWQTTGALTVGFVAKEAVISSWAQTYAVQQPAASRHPGNLGSEIRQAFEQSSGGHATAAVWAFLVFLLAYTPCVATLATQRREIGLRWTAFGLVLQLTVAWSLAVVIFQSLRLLL
ncbi:MAG TPA: ferrous iron transport protein B [Segeticoccus sp.]|uniref:ferrous iron transport protein B n=1 Tax=Segeticoccus sp. TaxID=2706531 RepID=UPI002D7F9AA2|nr:ferrous iron transport protein B [Segeticoccus sp.]HET8601975.1 ferrous iron transport protein B [Segeticoccus sp.]